MDGLDMVGLGELDIRGLEVVSIGSGEFGRDAIGVECTGEFIVGTDVDDVPGLVAEDKTRNLELDFGKVFDFVEARGPKLLKGKVAS